VRASAPVVYFSPGNSFSAKYLAAELPECFFEQSLAAE
jgi:hypothetical protein